MANIEKIRKHLVAEQIESRGVRDPLVLAAMRKVPRELFVPKALRDEAYQDSPLPIGSGQTISQPYIVAFMIEALALRGGEKVLEIGAGSGYAAAVLSEIAGEVYTVERIGQLADMAALNLANAGCENVHVRHADGTEGWADEAPFDAILVSAGAPDIPKTLERQLAVGGRMVVPVGSDPRAQKLIRITRVDADEFEREDIADVRFVPLIGKALHTTFKSCRKPDHGSRSRLPALKMSHAASLFVKPRFKRSQAPSIAFAPIPVDTDQCPMGSSARLFSWI